jgi:hypothetical protein
VAGRRGPFCCEQWVPDPDRARDCPLLSLRVPCGADEGGELFGAFAAG